MASNTSTVTGKPVGDANAFAACVKGGGKVTVTKNADGTITETCSLGGKSFSGPPKKAATPPANTTTKTPPPTTNKNPFQKAKADMDSPFPQASAALKFSSLSITTDGTVKGTVVKLNGKAIDNLRSLSFYHYPTSSYSPVELSFTTQEPTAQPGELSSYTSYSLRCPCVTPSYASSGIASAVASVQGASFEVNRSPTDPLAQSGSPGRNAFATAFGGKR